MKRSEMIKTLRNLFNKHMHCVDCCVTDEIMYSTILDGLVEAGMAAPITSKPIIIGRDGLTGEVAALDLSGGRGWEQE